MLLRPRPEIDRLGLDVQTTITPAPTVGDPRLADRLVANLVDNAIGHNVPGGRVQVSTSVVGGTAVLSVLNTGPVIPAGDLDRLFQPFQRLDLSRNHHNNGHGLGLSIVRAIATAHGATVTAHPRSEGGLSVSVTFPAPATPTQPARQMARK